MFSRADLKARAKANLKVYYWHAFIISFLLFMLDRGVNAGPGSGGSGEIVDSAGNVVSGSGGLISDLVSEITKVVGQLNTEIILATIGTLTVTLSIVGLMQIVLATFITNLLKVGESDFYLRSRRSGASAGIGSVLGMFTKKTYLPVCKTMFLRGLFISLWSLLLIVPGIVKMYEYYLVPFILAENPNTPTGEALGMSRSMMYGHKWECFELQLSFLGWFLLGALLCGVGVTFVYPYYHATMTEFYEGLRQLYTNVTE